MPIYGVGILHSVKDAETFGKYRDVAEEALAKHGGEIVVPPSTSVTLDGADNAQKVVLLSFPSMSAAQAWRDDPELQAIHAMRNSGVDMSVYAFGED
tara:strand:+ start:189 stop:479 length:291 start_codon:yes stop_codon:yes gene_type:complete